MSAFAVETDKRMLKAKERLEHVLDAGELLEMDRRLTTLFKQGQADAALLLCLNANVEAADPGTDKHSIMLHLYTRARRVREKSRSRASPGAQVVPAAGRADPGQHFEDLFGAADGADRAGRDAHTAGDADASAQISHSQFSDAVASTVEQLQGLDADGDLVNANIECCRQVAIEARRGPAGDGAPDEHVRAFEEERARRADGVAGRASGQHGNVAHVVPGAGVVSERGVERPASSMKKRRPGVVRAVSRQAAAPGRVALPGSRALRLAAVRH